MKETGGGSGITMPTPQEPEKLELDDQLLAILEKSKRWMFLIMPAKLSIRSAVH